MHGLYKDLVYCLPCFEIGAGFRVERCQIRSVLILLQPSFHLSALHFPDLLYSVYDQSEQGTVCLFFFAMHGECSVKGVKSNQCPPTVVPLVAPHRHATKCSVPPLQAVEQRCRQFVYHFSLLAASLHLQFQNRVQECGAFWGVVRRN